MKLRIVTIGKPKLAYARAGWDEYLTRLRRLEQVEVVQLADKFAADSARLAEVAQNSFVVALVVGGKQLDSPQLAEFLRERALAAQDVSFVIGGPDGLPADFIASANLQLGLSRLTFPHDLAMVITLEALYRASSIQAGLPYHH